MPRIARYARLMLNAAGRYPRLGMRSLRKPLSVSIHGVRLDLAEHVSEGIRYRMYAEKYERGEARCLIARIDKGDVILEIGGGIGFISTLAAKLVGSENVHCYEANPAMIPVIQATYAENGVSPHLWNKILGQEDGESTFYVDDDFTRSSTHDRSRGLREITVECVDVNREIERIRPTTVVMDIEGGEKELVPIMDWSEISKLVIELHPAIIGKDGVCEVLERLEQEGFRTDRMISSTNKRFMCKKR